MQIFGFDITSAAPCELSTGNGKKQRLLPAFTINTKTIEMAEALHDYCSRQALRPTELEGRRFSFAPRSINNMTSSARTFVQAIQKECENNPVNGAARD